MVFILYRLYFLSPTHKPTPYRNICSCLELHSIWFISLFPSGNQKNSPQGQGFCILPYLWGHFVLFVFAICQTVLLEKKKFFKKKILLLKCANKSVLQLTHKYTKSTIDPTKNPPFLVAVAMSIKPCHSHTLNDLTVKNTSWNKEEPDNMPTDMTWVGWTSGMKQSLSFPI